MLTSIGFRGTNGICSLKAHDSKNEQLTERYLYVVSKLGTDFQYKDIKSSIYCVTAAVNTGIWEEKDYYHEMYGRQFEYPELRDKYKLSCMSFNFIKTARNCAFHLYSMIHDNMHKSSNTEVNLVAAIQDRMRTTLHGDLHESEVFLHETAFYLHVSLELTRRGWKVIQVYDGFYASHEDKTRDLNQEITEILKQYVLEYVKKYVPKTAKMLENIEQTRKELQKHKIQQEAASFLHAHERMTIDFDGVYSKTQDSQKVNDLIAQNIANFYKQYEIVERNYMLQKKTNITESQQDCIASQRRCLKTSKINIRNIRKLQDFRHTVKHSTVNKLYQELFGDTEKWFRQCLFEQEYCGTRHFSEDFFKLTAKLRKELFEQEKRHI